MTKLFNQLNQGNANSNVGGIINMLKSSGNPMKTLEAMSSNNPGIAQMMKELRESGGDARTLFYRKAKEMGVDPQTILSKMK